ncbi:hypothetical protein G9A89_010438 [Geosiphon pyriformis]|nr:hypothetical protein G9A89_010438 [Geosiphon pyriformis]
MLQNNLEKIYVIEPNKKIAQAIFLPLIKIAQLVLVRNREELEITARGIQSFRSMDRIDVPVNMVEEKISNKEEIISTCQSISIPPYDQYMLVIKKKVKDQVQMFKAEATLCKSRKIGLIPERTTIRYLTAKIENQSPNSIPDFSQLCEYVDITSQTVYEQNKCYLLQPEQLKQINLENLDPLQYMQLKMLFNNFTNIFTSENKFGKTDIIQYQIKTKDTMPIKQRAYRMFDNRLIQPSISPWSLPVVLVHKKNRKICFCKSVVVYLDDINVFSKTFDDYLHHFQQVFERHNNQLPDKPVEFKIEDKVLLYHIKAEKQWSGKFDPK